MKHKKLPQLRLLVTTFCDSKCIYCRPSGEGITMSRGTLDLEMALRVAKLYHSYGGSEIKITGGDPVYWDTLVECVKALKNMGMNVEVITRSIRMEKLYQELINVGVDCINFSLDTLDVEKYKVITNKGSDDFISIINLIKTISSKIHTKINMVIMRGINVDEIDKMIQFCEKSNVKELKLLDLIEDLHLSKNTNANRLLEQYNLQLQELYANIEICNYGKARTEFQGGLGHPLFVYTTPQGLTIKVKNASNGAWYTNMCKDCNYYPCHDALMALRLTPENQLQLCLLNDKNIIDLTNDELQVEAALKQALSIYEDAFFLEGKNE